MALLVDGDVSGIDDLKAQDSGVLDVANGEGIDLRAKLGVARGELEAEIERFLEWEESGRLEQVAVCTALRQWHAMQTLAAVYRDAYFSQLNDRYGKRWEHYRKLAEERRREYFEGGVKLVSRPLRRPEHINVRMDNGTLAAATYWVQATFLDAYGAESAPSEVKVASSPLPHSMTVEALYPPAEAVQWNVFAGVQEDNIGLQNATPLPIGTAWSVPATGVVRGRPPGDGQSPGATVKRSGRIRRG